VGDIIHRRSRVAHPAATSASHLSLASKTRDGPADYHQEETTQHVCRVAPTPAAPVGCAIPPPTTHPGSIIQPRERLSPALDWDGDDLDGLARDDDRQPVTT